MSNNLIEILYEENKKSKDGHKLYRIRCRECGWETDIQLRHIKKLSSRCTHTNYNNIIKDTQNHTWADHRIENIFRGMIQRCYNQNNKSYRFYGAKNIRVCDEWINDPLSFEKWSINNNYSENKTIDRIDSTQDYNPTNCRWIDLTTNSKYKSSTNNITVNDITHTGRDWAIILGLGQNIINKYVRQYGLENTIIFIDRFQQNPFKTRKNQQSYYELYMN